MTDQLGRPTGGAAVTLVVHYPERDQVFTLPPTGASGTSFKTFTVPKIEAGTIVSMEFIVTYSGIFGQTRLIAIEAEPDPVRVDDAPAGAPQARIDADDANRFAPHSDVIAQGRTIGSRRSGVGSGSHGRKYGLRLVNALEGKRTEIAQLMLR